MKRISFLLLTLIAMMLSCKREEALQTIEYSMKEVVGEPSYTTCTITCKNEGVDDTSIHAKLLLALHEDLSDADVFPMRLIDGKLICQLSGLKQNTLYYYGFEVFTTNDNYRFKEVHSFKTLTSTELRIETAEIVNIGQTSAMGGGSVIGGEDVAVNERGICWSTNHNPTIDGNHLSSGYGLGEFEVNMRELSPGTRYYVRAYAVCVRGVVYGNEMSFTTLSIDLPELTTELVTYITNHSALGRGTVVSEGTSPVTERGVCWSINHNPTTNDNNLASGHGIGVYTVNMNNLVANTTYYARAYAINSHGTSYGNEVSFTTLPNSSVPSVTTSQVTNITQTTATGGGNVTDDGGSAVTERGICWSTYHSPTVSSNHASNSTGTGSYSVNINNLTPNTTYYVRAYATNSASTAYGTEVSFTTQQSVSLPTVTTNQITNIAQTTATGGGSVTSSGSGTVTARGVCWSTSHNPTMSSSHTIDGSGTGNFTSSMTNLMPNTTYYVRAYATNSAGTVYGTEVSFTTQQSVSQPTITTSQITNIAQTTATGGGSVTSSGGGTVTVRGICWSTSHNPTTSSSHTTDGSGTGSFTSNMTGLSPNATYYVRAYATNNAGTAYGTEVSFTTLSGSGGNAPTGAINGLFSVSATQQVWFSQGNLQYKASTNTWRFATNQYDYVGYYNASISSTYSGWIDLFGWGTSGYNHGAVCYQPWSTSMTSEDYYAYGSPTYNLYDQTCQADWGYNPISNGGNQTNRWRTLTKDEWYYVLNTRMTTSGIRYAKAKVNGENGVVLLPDDWSTSYYSLSSTNTSNASFSSNSITASQWSSLEQYGAVFLPAAGIRNGTGVYDVGSFGDYWSASYSGSYDAYIASFGDYNLYPQSDAGRFIGRSVRLVAPLEN